MKHIQKFENYRVDEGWKENTLVGLMSLFGSYAMGQKSDRIQVMHQKVKSETSMKSLIKILDVDVVVVLVLDVDVDVDVDVNVNVCLCVCECVCVCV